METAVEAKATTPSGCLSSWKRPLAFVVAVKDVCAEVKVAACPPVLGLLPNKGLLTAIELVGVLTSRATTVSPPPEAKLYTIGLPFAAVMDVPFAVAKLALIALAERPV